MIRKLESNHYCLQPRQIVADGGEWGAEASRVRIAAGHRDRATQIFKRARAPVPLQPRQKRSTPW